jgi:hypothetical protein
MADDLYNIFLQEIPSLYNRVQRAIIHCDDINVLEYFERRLEDHIHVIEAVVDQCQQREQTNVNEELIELLLTVHYQVNSLYETVQQLCFMHRDYNLDMGFVCPVEPPQHAGRPRFHVPQRAISDLYDIHRSWTEVAREAGVSYRTLL